MQACCSKYQILFTSDAKAENSRRKVTANVIVLRRDGGKGGNELLGFSEKMMNSDPLIRSFIHSFIHYSFCVRYDIDFFSFLADWLVDKPSHIILL